MNNEDDAWQRLADIEFNARLRNDIELLMMAPGLSCASAPGGLTSALPRAESLNAGGKVQAELIAPAEARTGAVAAPTGASDGPPPSEIETLESLCCVDCRAQPTTICD